MPSDPQQAEALVGQLRYLAQEGADRVVVNAHHLAEQVESFAAEHSGRPELVVVREESLLGTAGGVRNAISQFGSDPIVVVYGDVIFDVSLAPILAAHRESTADATITVYESDVSEGNGTIEVDGDDRILLFREKQSPVARSAFVPELVNAGLYVVEPGFVIEFVEAGRASDFGHDVFPDALARGVDLRVYRLPGPVLDIGTPEALSQANSEDDESTLDFPHPGEMAAHAWKSCQDAPTSMPVGSEIAQWKPGRQTTLL